MRVAPVGGRDRAGAGDAEFAAVDDYAASDLPESTKAALALVDAMIWTPDRDPRRVVARVREHLSDAQAVEVVLDVARNAANKIAVALRADAPEVTEGVQLFTTDADGTLTVGRLDSLRSVGFVDTLDRAQRRRSFLGLPVGVFFKFVDDQGPYLAAIVSFYATLAIFPILLLATSIFGFVLQGNPDLQEQVLNSTLATFPIIGEELGRPERLQGSTTGVIIGVLAATYGSLGLGQALQNALNVAWSVPRNNRPNPIALRLRSLLLLVTSGAFVVAITTVSIIGSPRSSG